MDSSMLQPIARRLGEPELDEYRLLFDDAEPPDLSEVIELFASESDEDECEGDEGKEGSDAASEGRRVVVWVNDDAYIVQEDPLIPIADSQQDQRKRREEQLRPKNLFYRMKIDDSGDQTQHIFFVYGMNQNFDAATASMNKLLVLQNSSYVDVHVSVVGDLTRRGGREKERTWNGVDLTGHCSLLNRTIFVSAVSLEEANECLVSILCKSRIPSIVPVVKLYQTEPRCNIDHDSLEKIVRAMSTGSDDTLPRAELQFANAVLDTRAGQILASSGENTKISFSGPSTWFDDGGAGFVPAFLTKDSPTAGPKSLRFSGCKGLMASESWEKLLQGLASKEAEEHGLKELHVSGMYFDSESREILMDQCNVATKDVSTQCPERIAGFKRKMSREMPKSAFMLYSKQRKLELKQGPRLSPAQQSKTIRDEFQQMSSEQLEPWNRKAAQTKADYDAKVDEMSGDLEFPPGDGIPVQEREQWEEFLGRSDHERPPSVFALYCNQRLDKDPDLDMMVISQDFRFLDGSSSEHLARESERRRNVYRTRRRLRKRCKWKRSWDHTAGLQMQTI